MVTGIGTDIIEIKRILDKTENSKFMDRVFTKGEQEYIASKANKAQSGAGIFCAKEAVLKALSKGITDIPLTDIEVFHTNNGAPYCEVKGSNAKISISISHCKEYATAIAVAEVI